MFVTFALLEYASSTLGGLSFCCLGSHTQSGEENSQGSIAALAQYGFNLTKMQYITLHAFNYIEATIVYRQKQTNNKTTHYDA